MLINFIGSPCSGKTTSAAKLFAELKEMGMSVEFISEYARYYIARKRVDCIKTNKPFTLTDEDQKNIFIKQLQIENTMLSSGDNETVVISDSSIWNSVLYMTDNYRQDIKSKFDIILMPHAFLQDGITRNNSIKILNFISAPVERPFVKDNNRVHSKEESIIVHNNIRPILKEFLTNSDDIPMLIGSIDERHKAIMKLVYERLF